MPWTSRLLGTAIVLVALTIAGCKVTDFSLFGLVQTTGNGETSERLLPGSANDVAMSVQLSLAQLGLHAVATQESEALRIKSISRNGKTFSLILTRKISGNAEWTHVRVEWDNGADEAFLLELLGEMGKPKGK